MDTAARGDLALPENDFIARAASGPWPAFKQDGALSPSAEIFLRGLHEDASADELGDLSTEDLLALAHDFWIWRAERASEDQAVRIRKGAGAGGRAIGRDILEIAGPDMPFLVDSVMGELTEQGVAALAMFHPLAPAISGGAHDSLIQIHVAPLSASRTKALHDGVRATLADVRISVADYHALRRRMLDRASELQRAETNAARDDVNESVELLRWLAADRFTFLGARDYEYARDETGALRPDEPVIVESSGLGLLRDSERYVLRSTAEPLLLTPELQRLINEPTPLIVAKSTLRSRVHRRTAADYIGVKRYGPDGEVVGETRFVGLFTSEAFIEPTRDIPVLRKKLEWVMREAGFVSDGHNAKTLRHILDVYPRDELWQIEREDLLRTSRGVLHLIDRPRPRAFARRDRFNRFVSVLTYLPKDRFNSELREKVGRRLEEAYGGKVEAFYPELGEGPLARVHFVIGDIDRARPDPDPIQLDNDVAALTRTWEDTFADALAVSDRFDSAAREEVRDRFEHAFSAAYRERYGVEEALIDAAQIMADGAWAIRARVYRLAKDTPDVMRCKFYVQGDVLALSATVPILENLGLYVASEQNFQLTLDGALVHVQEIKARAADGAAIDLAESGAAFEQAFVAIWTGQAENDGFNRLVLKLGAPWRDAALIRALARYRQQTGLDPSQSVQEAALANHPDTTSLILALFRVRFDPNLPETPEARADWAAQIDERIEAALNAVESLDDDRALRRMAALVSAIQRTNFYQRGADGGVKSYMSFKIASESLADLPAPKPYREIWVASPQVEGVHLRMGAVARGGLRWSDRRDDFRTEILDLVKAQQVKNAIIVPVGAKGGFFPKRLPARDVATYRDVAIDAYKTFLRGLLDITDNLDGETVIAPAQVVRWDGDDPYLVVAADKGTAAFSDIANSISAEYGFWLGDAFASGGSVGYDHKEMGITAKGAWVAVQRHFRELGKNIQEEPFSVIGVGDMSGDVFGNGMLLSKRIKLIAAFDHRDIFLDPEPTDLDASWAERARLFKLPRSSWADYDTKLISPGGGVFSRSLKSISISKEIAALTGLTTDQVTPAELMCALLKTPCELLWFGGIGNFIKARAESNAEVGDKANDGVRVDAEDVRARVIGEGANLGVTQQGRVCFARGGGRINTDAVDNSAGVDTSDHEVNIKILLAEAVRCGALDVSARAPLLESMTPEVGELVLRDNYNQTLALSLSEASAAVDLDSHERLMQRLEAAGKFSRTVEGLPSAAEIATLRGARQGLTRPGLAKLIAHAKIDLFDVLAASDVPDDPVFAEALKDYFPSQLDVYEAARHRHRLRREIIATGLADAIVNRGGPTFVDRTREIARVDAVAVARGFEAARRLFGFDDLAARINALDNKVPAAAQIALHQEIAGALRRVTAYLARREGARDIGETVSAYQDSVAAQREAVGKAMSDAERVRVEARTQALVKAGAPTALAKEAALLGPLAAALDVADLARAHGWKVAPAAEIYRAVGAAFSFDALRAAAMNLPLDQHYDRLVLRRAAEDLAEAQRVIAQAVAQSAGAPPKRADSAWAIAATRAWSEAIGAPAQNARAAVTELEVQGPWTFAKVMLAAAEINALANAAR